MGYVIALNSVCFALCCACLAFPCIRHVQVLSGDRRNCHPLCQAELHDTLYPRPRYLWHYITLLDDKERIKSSRRFMGTPTLRAHLD